MRFLRLLPVLAVFGMMTSVALAQSATPLFDWAGNPGNTELTTTAVTNYTDGSLAGREIAKLWFARDAEDYYFRLDMVGAPTNLNPHPSNFAEAYSIDIQYASGGGDHTDSNYIAEGLTDITYLLMTHAAESCRASLRWIICTPTITSRRAVWIRRS